MCALPIYVFSSSSNQRCSPSQQLEQPRQEKVEPGQSTKLHIQLQLHLTPYPHNDKVLLNSYWASIVRMMGHRTFRFLAKGKAQNSAPIKRQANLASKPPHFNQHVQHWQLLPYTCLTLRSDRCGSRHVALSPRACMRHFETMSKTLHPRICLWRERRFGPHAATNAALR